MTTYYHDVFRKAADAIEGVITALKGTSLSGVTVFKGASMSDLSVPRIEILCDSGDVEVEGATVTGNYTISARIRLVGHGSDETRTTYSADVAALGDIIFRDDFIAQVTTAAISNFTGFQWFPRRVRESVEGNTYVTEWECDFYCMPS